MPDPLIFTAFIAAVAWLGWWMTQPNDPDDDHWGLR